MLRSRWTIFWHRDLIRERTVCFLTVPKKVYPKVWLEKRECCNDREVLQELEGNIALFSKYPKLGFRMIYVLRSQILVKKLATICHLLIVPATSWWLKRESWGLPLWISAQNPVQTFLDNLGGWGITHGHVVWANLWSKLFIKSRGFQGMCVRVCMPGAGLCVRASVLCTTVRMCVIYWRLKSEFLTFKP